MDGNSVLADWDIDEYTHISNIGNLELFNNLIDTTHLAFYNQWYSNPMVSDTIDGNTTIDIDDSKYITVWLLANSKNREHTSFSTYTGFALKYEYTYLVGDEEGTTASIYLTLYEYDNGYSTLLTTFSDTTIDPYREYKDDKIGMTIDSWQSGDSYTVYIKILLNDKYVTQFTKTYSTNTYIDGYTGLGLFWDSSVGLNKGCVKNFGVFHKYQMKQSDSNDH